MSDLPPAELSTPCDTNDDAILNALTLEDALDAYGVCAGQRNACSTKVDLNREWRRQASQRATGDDE